MHRLLLIPAAALLIAGCGGGKTKTVTVTSASPPPAVTTPTTTTPPPTTPTQTTTAGNYRKPQAGEGRVTVTGNVADGETRRLPGTGDTFVPGKPRVWVPTRIALGNPLSYAWDLAPDGKRVAVLTPVTAATRVPARQPCRCARQVWAPARRRVM